VNKAYFFPRVIAYFIDMILIMIASYFISFIVPQNKDVSVLNKELSLLQQEYLNKEISADDFIDRGSILVYESDYANSGGIIIQVIIIILYFIIFQFYNNGQTFGKKLMGIKVINNDGGKLTFNSMVYRSLVINSILVNFISICCLYFMNASSYYSLAAATQVVNGIIFVVTMIMVMYKKDGRGIHDIISGTKVVMVK